MAPRKKKKSDDTASPGAGHNASAELRAFIERIERLLEEKSTVLDDIKDVYGELKGRGYDARAVRKIIAERAADREKLDEIESITQVYRDALGMRAPGDGIDHDDSGEDDDESENTSSDDDDTDGMV